MLFNLANSENLTGVSLHVKLIRQFYEHPSPSSAYTPAACHAKLLSGGDNFACG